MHELSVVLGLLDIVGDAAGADARATVVHVRLGVLSGVCAQALEFAFQIASAGTVAAGARLEIETVPVRMWCPSCAATLDATPRAMCCPGCAARDCVIVSGRELEVTWIEVEDPVGSLAVGG